MQDYTQIQISAVEFFGITLDFTPQAVGRIKTEARLSKDGRVSAFMPCSHSLASDVRGFSFSGRETTGGKETGRNQDTWRTGRVEPCTRLGGAGYE